MKKLLIILVLGALYCSADAENVTVFTSFEFAAPAPFTIGTSPDSMEITAGVAQTVGQPAFYHSGFFSWHIRPGEMAMGIFEIDASALSFWARTTSTGVTSRIRIFDVNNNELLNESVPNNFLLFSVARASGETLISRFEVSNTSSAGDVVVDDLSFTTGAAIPIPDADGDGTPDASDNCIDAPNGPTTHVGANIQRDTDNDGYGNVCDPDLNNDILVTVTDFLILRGVLNEADEDADLNGDGLVTVTDFLILRSFLNQPPGPSAFAP